MNITVLGASGMLGSMLVDYLSPRHTVIATVRDIRPTRPELPVIWKRLEVTRNYQNTQYLLWNAIRCADVIINAIGVTGKRSNSGSMAINFMLPSLLSSMSKTRPIIQIATDCVFDGKTGNYTEESYCNATDEYGVSKRMGEIKDVNFHNLRCSIIGPEPYETPVNLLGWFLSQPKRSTVKGYTNHYWNGITTLHFAKICDGLINNGMNGLPNIQHVVPADSVSKYELLCLFRDYFRPDITVEPCEVERIDRTLKTQYQLSNTALWRMAGYERPPTIEIMIKELSEYLK